MKEDKEFSGRCNEAEERKTLHLVRSAEESDYTTLKPRVTYMAPEPVAQVKEAADPSDGGRPPGDDPSQSERKWEWMIVNHGVMCR